MDRQTFIKLLFSITMIDKIKGEGTVNTISEYVYFDSILNQNNSSYYRLKQVDFDGTTTYSNTISISNAQAITIFKSGENAATINGENFYAYNFFNEFAYLITMHRKMVLIKIIFYS